jgi:hypothetical protein
VAFVSRLVVVVGWLGGHWEDERVGQKGREGKGGRAEEFRIGILIFVRDDLVLLRVLCCKVYSHCIHPWGLLSRTAKSLVSTRSLAVLSLLGEVIPEKQLTAVGAHLG